MRFAAKSVTNELNFSFCFILTQSIHVKNFFTNAMTGSLLTLIKSSLLTYLFTKKIINFIFRHLNFSLPSDAILVAMIPKCVCQPLTARKLDSLSASSRTWEKKKKSVSIIRAVCLHYLKFRISFLPLWDPKKCLWQWRLQQTCEDCNRMKRS